MQSTEIQRRRVASSSQTETSLSEQLARFLQSLPGATSFAGEASVAHKYLLSRLQDSRAVLEHEQRTLIGTFLKRACVDAPAIRTVLVGWDDDTIDVVFVVLGDLYDGETRALSVMHQLRLAFPNHYFDVMIIPGSAADQASIASWHMDRELVFQRSDVTQHGNS